MEESEARLRKERDLYLRLLLLIRQTEIEVLLREALALIVELSEAQHGYLELYDDDSGTPRWWIAHGFSDGEVEHVRDRLSSGIIAQAIATGGTVTTAAAQEDPRFRERESVHLKQIEAVLCTPVGPAPPRGVLYLQGRERRGRFTDEERSRAETFVEHLAPLVDLLLERARVAPPDPTARLRETLDLDGIIGRSPALAATFKQVALVAPLDIHVLLTGDSGTGKSQLARAIHRNGPRASGPFVELNCAALPESLLESELFGALPGAHSTAVQRVEGKVAAAEHGTLFLDEISELTAGAQAKLLQLLQSKEYYPLGSAKAVLADIRLIAATNIDLAQAVAERRFREDLYYRVHVVGVRLPTLAERRGDIPLLANHFCLQTVERYDLPRLVLSRNALWTLESAPWPGNVRQLQHVVEAAAIRAAGSGATQVEAAHLFPRPDDEQIPEGELTLQEATRRVQARLLREVLEETGWNILETSRRLDVARSHVYKLIHTFGFERGGKRAP